MFFVANASKRVVSEHFEFGVVFGGPGGFKKLREACRKNVHQSSSKSEIMGPSYDRKTKLFNDKKSNDYFNVSVENFLKV